MARVVLDANVLVSAFIVQVGKPARILRGPHLMQLLTSEGILAEVATVLHYPRIQKKYGLKDQDIDAYLADLPQRCELIAVRTIVAGVSTDPDDDKILACAVDGRADFIVSGDPHLLDIKVYKGIRIVSPNTFLSLLEQEP